MEFEPIPESDEKLATQIIGAAIEVHRVLGPGFIEFIYEQALIHELRSAGIQVERQKRSMYRIKASCFADSGSI